jgi:hypothetical protein
LGSEERKKKGKGKGRLTGGAQVSASWGKRKRRGGPAQMMDDGPLGRLGWKGSRRGFLFFPFSNFIFKPFFFSNSNQTFSNFFSRIL